MPDAVYKIVEQFVGIGFFVLRVERSWNLERILILLHNFMCGRFWERDERTEEILVLTINFSHENSKLIFLISGSHLGLISSPRFFSYNLYRLISRQVPYMPTQIKIQ